MSLLPEAIDDPPLTLDVASRLMADLGFLAFRTPPGTQTPDSCLMAMIRERPTRRHFDPEVVTYWASRGGRGILEYADYDTATPIDDRFSWGKIRLIDRLANRNSFVGFGGVLTGERVAPDALLLVFRSPAPILRLPGHSQRQDLIAEEVLTFFARLVPRLWSSPADERLVAAASPSELYAAFLLHSIARLQRSPTLREAITTDASVLRGELKNAALHRPETVEAGRALRARLRLSSDETSVHAVSGRSATGAVRAER